MAYHNTIGEIGEDIAKRFLMKRGFEIVEQNYTKKWGEIDIIAKKRGILHFVEVKSVSHVTSGEFSRETHNRPKPEEMVHEKKQKRLGRAIQTYLTRYISRLPAGEAGVTPDAGGYTPEWQFDIAAVFVDTRNRVGRVRLTENVIL